MSEKGKQKQKERNLEKKKSRMIQINKNLQLTRNKKITSDGPLIKLLENRRILHNEQIWALFNIIV